MHTFSRLKHPGQVTRSGPELRRKPSRGTNINPFTPIEYQRRIKSHRTTSSVRADGNTIGGVTSTPLLEVDEAKPQKVSGVGDEF